MRGKKSIDAAELDARLRSFAKENTVSGKGPLSVLLILTRAAKSKIPPYNETDFLTRKGGQVAGLGGPAVQAILADHGIERILAEEGGRTSRGSIQRMQKYVTFLNDLALQGAPNFEYIEAWWIERVREHFASQPLRVRMDPSKSVRQFVSELIEAAIARQKECPGTMVAGAVMQHLVGAKLQLALPETQIEHKGFSVADAPSGRKGDYLIGDTAIHVTTTPSEALLRKCRANLNENLRPLIITSSSGMAGAVFFAQSLDISDRVDIFEVEQFIAVNIHEWCAFAHDKRPTRIAELIQTYNALIDQCETDPSLKIVFG